MIYGIATLLTFRIVDEAEAFVIHHHLFNGIPDFAIRIVACSRINKPLTALLKLYRLFLRCMRRFLHRNRWATLLVIGLLMFASSGMMLSRMTCLIAGHSIYSIGLIEGCCPEDDHEMATIEAVCCEIGQVARNTGAFVGHAGPDLVVLLLCLDAAPWATITLPEPAPLAWLESRPPPEHSGERLATLGSLLI